MPSLKLCPKNSIFSYLKRETSKSCVHTFNKRGFATVNNSLFAPSSVTKEHAGSVYNSNRSLFRSIKGATCSRVVQFRDGNYGIVVGMLDKQTFSEAAKTYPRQIEGVTIRLSEEGPFISGSQRRPVSPVEVSYDEAYQGLRTFYKDKPDVYGVAKTQVGGKEGFLLFVSDNSDITISSTFQYPVQVSKSGVFKAGSSFRHGHNKDTSRYITSNPQWPTTCTSTMSALIKLPDNIVEKDKLFILGCGHSHIAYNHPFQLHPQVITSLQFAGMDDGMAFDPIGPVLFKKSDLEVATISVSPSVDPPIGFTRLVQVGGVVDVSISEITNLDSLPLKNQVKSIGQFDASQKTYYMLADKEYPVNIVSLEDDIYHIDSGHYYYSLRDVCLLETKTVEEHKRAFIPGHSGAPIVDSQGALVAVYNGANRQFGIATTTEKTTNLIYSIFNSRWKLAQ